MVTSVAMLSYSKKLMDDVVGSTPESLSEAEKLLQLIAQGEADLQAGRVVPQNQALDRIRLRLERSQR